MPGATPAAARPDSNERLNRSYVTWSDDEYRTLLELMRAKAPELGLQKDARLIRLAVAEACARSGIDASVFRMPLRRAPRQSRRAAA